ncbi:MAG: molybdopterin-dependent oxidoreductase [Gammaproteobacteria bacterium]|nr:molybdopterin-dependent oxidoreductase [Gammaproteobacteria bacterium]MDP2347998.1 molybdopterin-dependent oxidoreductase [Gammaproteobacteria bacterium]
MIEEVTSRTTCPYCGVGCGVEAKVLAGVVNSISGIQSHPANLGRLCVKGSALHETMGEHGRLLHPRIAGVRTDWNTALDHVSASLRKITKKHGPDSVAFYLSGQLLTEDYYVANKLMKGFVGSANVDTNSRLCMASAVAGYKRAFGADAVPCNYEDLECCDLLVMIGSNAAWTHPILYQRIVAAKAARPHMRVVVIDPRRTATCDIADLHLPLRPGADAFVFAGLLHYLNARRALDRDYIANHTEGFDTALAACEEFDMETTAQRSGLDTGALEQFYQWFARTEKTVTFYSQGINQSATGTDKCNAIINCHLATGKIGKPGMGPFSITGQPNAMGGREVGGLANQLAAHMDFTSENVDRVARFWKTEKVATQPGLKAVDMFDAIESGRIKAVWIMATNPVVSLPESERVRAALLKCELVIVSDCVENTDTNACADVLLPATGWGEKDGTVTNSERRISRQRALLPPVGEAKHDWWIICEVAKRLGYTDAFTYESAADIFREHAALSAFENDGGRDFDISAFATLEKSGYDALEPVQWPVNATNPHGTARMFVDGKFFTPSGRARFITLTPALPQPEQTFDTPFLLNTGRLRDQWHTMTRTGRAPRLLAHTGAPFVAINPRDAMSKGIREGDLVRLHNDDSRGDRQELVLEARIDSGMRDGDVFVPIHWNDQFAANSRVSRLIAPNTDPFSGQPESKYAPVGLHSVKAQRWVAVISREPLSCNPLPTGPFDYWVKTPVTGGWRYLLADTSMPTAETESAWQKWSSDLMKGLEKIELSNTVTGDHRMLLCRDQQIEIALFAGKQRSSLPEPEWLQSLLEHKVDTHSWRLLARQETAAVNAGRVICSCCRITEQQITGAIDKGARSAEDLGRALRCGTNCGSCIPELKQLIAGRTH